MTTLSTLSSSAAGPIVLAFFVITSLAFAILWNRERARSSKAHRQAVTERLALAHHYDSVTRFASDAILLFDADLRVIDANDKALSLYGYSLEEFRRLNALDLRPSSGQASIAAIVQLADGVGSARYEAVHVNAKGHLFPVEASLRAMTVEGRRMYQNIVRDITARKRSEAELGRLVTHHQMHARINGALLRSPNQEVAFKRICQLVVTLGGYSAALIFLTGDDDVARIVASEGLSPEAAESLSLDLKLGPASSAVTSRAIREGRVQVSNDYLADPTLASLRSFARASRIQSVAACPLRRAGQVIGAMSFIASTPDFFPAEETERLEALAQDLSSALDTFAERRALDAAHARDRQQSIALEQSPVSVVITDTAGTIEYVNPKFTAVTGYSYEEAIGQNPRVLKSGEMTPDGYGQLWKTITAGGVWRGEFHNRRKNGESYWESVSISPVRNEQGVIVRFVAVKEDITELKVVREAAEAGHARLVEAEAQFRAMFEEAPVAYHEIDAQGIVVRVNQAECKLMQREASDLIGQPVWNSVRSELRALSQDAVQRKLSGDLPLMVFSREYLRGDGTLLSLEIHESLVRNVQGTVIGIRSAMLDITEQKEAAAARQTALAAAGELGRAKLQFLHNMSHELRTPINGILGFAELLLSDESLAANTEAFTAIRDCGLRLRDLVQDILNVADAGDGVLRLEPAEFSVRTVLAETLHAFAPRAEAKGLRLTGRVDDGVPARLLGDSRRLGQVLSSLLDNAVRFTEAGELRLSVETEANLDQSGFLRFTVTDTGIGIDEALKARIFHPFMQVDESHTRRHGGAGLGLALCAELVKLMGGRIWVESQPGHGSTFHFNARFAAA